YFGSLLSVNFLSSQTVIEDNNKFALGETISVGGAPFSVIGSGWVQPGISILGIVVPTGLRVDAILVRSVDTGALRLLYPENAPWATGMVALVVDMDPVGYNRNTFSPLCVTRETRLAAAGGVWRAAGEIAAGELLVDRTGQRQRVLATVRVGMNGPVSPLSETVRLPEGAGLSRQHRVVISGPPVALYLGEEEVMAPAIALADAGLARVTPARVADYVHILTEDHAVLVAEGTEVESLLLGGEARTGLTGEPEIADGILAELEARFPDAARKAAMPLVTRREGAFLLAAGARPVHRGHPEQAACAA
ncbi:MAG: hypothetical protein RIR62_2254, partial [Pseudomonadota bacterium]